tara:strand:+ start:1578 stop:2261 length:684 start_codon:yes stop_codon:yes gene_type:complete
MTRQTKIIIFSVIIIFSIILSKEQTKEDSVVKTNAIKLKMTNLNRDKKNNPIKVVNKKKPGKYDLLNIGLTDIPEGFKVKVVTYPQPKNGFSPYNSYFGKGTYNNKSGNIFVIDNSNKTDAVVLLVNAYSGRKVRNEYVRKGANFKMTGIPNGTYYLEWFSGNDWSPNLKVGSRFKGGFQSKASFTKTKDRNDWMSVDGYKQWTLTLYSFAGGDVESEKINADEFFN